MEKKLIVLFTVAVLFATSCKKTEDNSPTGTTTQNTACLQQSATNYDAQGGIISQSLYYYTNNRLDSIVRISGVNRNTTVYSYLNSNKREEYSFSNGVKNENYNVQQLDINGNIIEAYGVVNGQKQGGSIKYSYNCN